MSPKVGAREARDACGGNRDYIVRPEFYRERSDDGMGCLVRALAPGGVMRREFMGNEQRAYTDAAMGAARFVHIVA